MEMVYPIRKRIGQINIKSKNETPNAFDFPDKFFFIVLHFKICEIWTHFKKKKILFILQLFRIVIFETRWLVYVCALCTLHMNPYKNQLSSIALA